MPTSYMERSLADLRGSIGDIGAAMRARAEKKRREDLERALLGETAESYKLRDLAEDNQLERELRKAQITKMLREPVSRTAPLDAEGLTPYQRKQLEISLRREERLSNPQPKQKADTFKTLDDEVKAATGVSLAEWDAAPKESKGIVDGRFQADVGGNKKSMSADLYQRFLDRYNKIQGGGEPNADPYVQQVKPQVASKEIPNGALVVNSPEEAAKLPPGTVFYTPDGRRKVRP